MDNRKVIEQTLENYEIANQAMLDLWEHLDPEIVDEILEKQQNRLEQIAQRLYHEDRNDDLGREIEILNNTLSRYDWANQYLYEHWDTLPDDERLSIMQKQWNRLDDMRNRNVNFYKH